MLQVRIDRKIASWSGSIEMGVTACDPSSLPTPLPSSATELRNDSWIMSGNSILKDGRSVNESYGTDLDKLQEGDLSFLPSPVVQASCADPHLLLRTEQGQLALLTIDTGVGMPRLDLVNVNLKSRGGGAITRVCAYKDESGLFTTEIVSG